MISSTQRLLPDNTKHPQGTDIHAPRWDSNPQSQQTKGVQSRAFDHSASDIGFVYILPKNYETSNMQDKKNTLSVMYLALPFYIYWRYSTIMGSLDIQFMAGTYVAFYKILYLISPIDGSSYFYAHL